MLPMNALALGGQSIVVPNEPTPVQGSPCRSPALHVPLWHTGHGEAASPVMYTRAKVSMLSDSAPLLLRSTWPQTSFSTALMEQTERAGIGPGTGVGGPKKQFASRAQALTVFPQSVSEVQACGVDMLTQCRAGPAPLVQSAGPVPSEGPTVSTVPVVPVTATYVENPSGSAFPPTKLARPPPS